MGRCITAWRDMRVGEQRGASASARLRHRGRGHGRAGDAPVSTAAQVPATNRVIASLPRTVRDRLMRHCESVELVLGAVLCECEQPYRYAYFPLTAYIALVLPIGRRPALGMELIGDEGMLDATLVLGVNEAPMRAMVQGAGSAWRISVTQLHRAMRDSRVLRDTLSRYLHALIIQLAQSAACASFHEVEARLARWLLMTRDRAHADRFHLTHQCLADMLGVQRSAVTLAAGRLQEGRLIRYSRGRIDVLSRSGLEAVSCGCYAASLRAYAQRFPHPVARRTLQQRPGRPSGS